jgi:diaminohydroxyphosphoribosylaminopyrimidine deaminase / 5-amino-6-(5-phosphoribosylamino)uracil reductase
MTLIQKKYMMRAIRLAKKGSGKTFPNPVVGAIVVKDDRIIGEGYHKKAGLPHAEVIALRKAGKKANGADLYVSLEPCSHYGKTPPCVLSIVKYGIKKVFLAMNDPNPIVNGKGVKFLRKKGIKVRTGICSLQAKRINKDYISYIKEK